MTSIVVNGNAAFGGMSNQVIRQIYSTDTMIKRVNDAAAQASSGYNGTPGTEFEGNPGNPGLFGVQPSGTAGEQGSAWQYAFNSLNTAWNNFMAAAENYLEALDNG